jgi:hypothetical protein
MSTLFDTYYDALGHEMHIGDICFIKVKGRFIFGSVVKFDFDKNGNIKYVVVPSAKYIAMGIDDLKRSYKVSDRNIFLAVIKKKN